MFQPSNSVTETNFALPMPTANGKAAVYRKRNQAIPKQHFGLLPTEPMGPPSPSPERRRFLEVSAALRPLIENPRMSSLTRREEAVRRIRSMNLTMTKLHEMTTDIWSRCWGPHPSVSDPIERDMASLTLQASLILASRVTAQHRTEAFTRLRFISTWFGVLPKECCKQGLRRMFRDLTALVEGDDKVLPQRPDDVEVEHDGRVKVPPYLWGHRYEAEDDLLLDSTEAWPDPQLVVGATYALHPYGGRKDWIAPGYEGTPPSWLVGRVARVSRTHWDIETPAPYSYVWKLPRRGWGVTGRVVGYQRDGQQFRTDH